MKSSSSSKNINHVLRYVLIGFSILLLGLFALAAFTYKSSTPPFLDTNDQAITNSIAEERYLNLGGVEQYVLIRGQNRSAPLLVHIHGGPGTTATPFLRTFNTELEEDFVVVYWDQRGTAKSFDAASDPSSLSISQLTNDLAELIDTVLAEFNQDKVLLVAHSWGTILGLEHVAAHPETVAAYVAISQTTNQLESDLEGFEWALAEAKASEQNGIVTQLEKIGEPPYTIDEFVTQRRLVNQLGGGLVQTQSDLDLLRTALATPEFAWPHVLPFLRGSRLSGAALWSEQQEYNAFEQHSTLDVPVFLILGRNDRVISPQLGETYFDALNAPSKELIWFEASAHSPHFEEPEKFNALVKQIAETVGLLTQ